MWVADRNRELREIGTAAYTLSDEERQEAALCAERLAPTGRTLTQAVDFYLAHLAVNERSITVNEAVAELLARKAAMGMSKRYIAEMKHQLERVKEAFGARKVTTLTTQELEGWLLGRKLAPISHANARRYLSILFNHCIKQGSAKTNPAEAMDTPKVMQTPPGILTPAAMRALIGLAREHHPDLLAAVLIQAFAGLRREEVRRLDWTEVNLARGYIEIKALKSKTAQRRLVTVRPNLAEFLAPLRREHGPVAPSCYDKCAAKLRERLESKKHRWPENALRHSFASYHLADCQDAAKTALQLGHKGAGMLFEHYRELVTPEDAAAWWAISPGAAIGGNVVELGRVGAAPSRRRKAGA